MLLPITARFLCLAAGLCLAFHARAQSSGAGGQGHSLYDKAHIEPTVVEQSQNIFAAAPHPTTLSEGLFIWRDDGGDLQLRWQASGDHAIWARVTSTRPLGEIAEIGEVRLERLSPRVVTIASSTGVANSGGLTLEVGEGQIIVNASWDHRRTVVIPLMGSPADKQDLETALRVRWHGLGEERKSTGSSKSSGARGGEGRKRPPGG